MENQVWIKKDFTEEDMARLNKLLSKTMIREAKISDGVLTYTTLLGSSRGFAVSESDSDKIIAAFQDSGKKESCSMLDNDGMLITTGSGFRISSWPSGSNPRLIYRKA